MEVEFTLKIKDNHNPPTLDKELGKGVIAKLIIDFPEITEENLDDEDFLLEINNQSFIFITDFIEVTYEPITDD